MVFRHNNGNNNVDNEKLSDVVNGYFTNVKTANLSYTVSNNMYYWDIAKEVYGNSTYWPVISAYNKYNIITPIKKTTGRTIAFIVPFCTVSLQNHPYDCFPSSVCLKLHTKIATARTAIAILYAVFAFSAIFSLASF